ncbi:MAG: twin-arginine translocation signal domain-containing protein [Rhodothermaceae bacterium]
MEKSRRNFLTTLGKGAVGAAILSYLPFKIFAGEKNKKRSSIKVKIHPQAVKRTK